MLSAIQQNEEYLTALSSVSPNLRKFLVRLNEGDKLIKWARLDKDGCKQSDGSYFRVMASQRTAKEQLKLFKQGRDGVKYDNLVYLTPQGELCAFPNSRKYEIINRGKVVSKKDVATNAWVGESYHNWGLALDLCVRKFGDSEVIKLSDGLMSLDNYYKLIGLEALAKDCGLEWGGNWTDFLDVVHFQDSSIKIPDKKYWFDKNMNFTFITALSERGISVKSSVKAGFGFGLAIVAYFVYKFLGGKRK